MTKTTHNTNKAMGNGMQRMHSSASSAAVVSRRQALSGLLSAAALGVLSVVSGGGGGVAYGYQYQGCQNLGTAVADHGEDGT